jgi:hypothetical protein
MKRVSHCLLTLKVIILFICLSCGFRFFGFDRTRQTMLRRTRKISSGPPCDVDKLILERIVAAVDAATRYYYRKRLDCLPRAMVIYYLARRSAVPVEFCLGVKKYPFAGHSWVEYQGEIIGDRPNRVKPYTVLVRE